MVICSKGREAVCELVRYFASVALKTNIILKNAQKWVQSAPALYPLAGCEGHVSIRTIASNAVKARMQKISTQRGKYTRTRALHSKKKFKKIDGWGNKREKEKRSETKRESN